MSNVKIPVMLLIFYIDNIQKVISWILQRVPIPIKSTGHITGRKALLMEVIGKNVQ